MITDNGQLTIDEWRMMNMAETRSRRDMNSHHRPRPRPRVPQPPIDDPDLTFGNGVDGAHATAQAVAPAVAPEAPPNGDDEFVGGAFDAEVNNRYEEIKRGS